MTRINTTTVVKVAVSAACASFLYSQLSGRNITLPSIETLKNFAQNPSLPYASEIEGIRRGIWTVAAPILQFITPIPFMLIGSAFATLKLDSSPMNLKSKKIIIISAGFAAGAAFGIYASYTTEFALKHVLMLNALPTLLLSVFVATRASVELEPKNFSNHVKPLEITLANKTTKFEIPVSPQGLEMKNSNSPKKAPANQPEIEPSDPTLLAVNYFPLNPLLLVKNPSL